MDIISTAEKSLSHLNKMGSDKAMVQVTFSECKEFNVESNRMTLLRTTFDQNATVTAIKDKKMASVSGNQTSDDHLFKLTERAYQSALAAPADDCNGFAPAQGSHQFESGSGQVSEEWMYNTLKQLLDECGKGFSKIVLENCNLKFNRHQSCLMTTDGTKLVNQNSYYDGFIMFTAKSGRKSSSFNYIDFQIPTSTASTPYSFIQSNYLKNLLAQSEEQLEVRRIPEKFVGDVIVTPHCMSDIVGNTADFIGSGRLLQKTSFLSGKLNQQVASPMWSLTSNPNSDDFASKKFWTRDGYLSVNETLFENGVLKSYILNHYAARKLNESVTKSEASYLSLKSGNSSLPEMISSVKRGILMCRFSGGRPAENGDLSGVAKNSYYIENGKIQYPVTETMVSANLGEMIRNIRAVSSESLNSGTSKMPWIQFADLSIS